MLNWRFYISLWNETVLAWFIEGQRPTGSLHFFLCRYSAEQHIVYLYWIGHDIIDTQIYTVIGWPLNNNNWWVNSRSKFYHEWKLQDKLKSRPYLVQWLLLIGFWWLRKQFYWRKIRWHEVQFSSNQHFSFKRVLWKTHQYFLLSRSSYGTLV